MLFDHMQGDRSLNAALLPGNRVSLCDINFTEPSFLHTLDELRADPGRLAGVAKNVAPIPECGNCPALAICGGPPATSSPSSEAPALIPRCARSTRAPWRSPCGTTRGAMNVQVRTALVSTAGHCKVACGFCFRADRAHGFLDTATYTRTLSRLREAGVEGVCLTGGEPTHHPQLRQLVRLAHQFGMSVSMVTSARSVAEVIALSHVTHLLSNVTVSADSQGAMLLGRTTRTAASGIATLRAISTETKILHVTCWGLSDDECQELADLVSEAGVEVQFSPVVLDERALRRDGKSVRTIWYSSIWTPTC